MAREFKTIYEARAEVANEPEYSLDIAAAFLYYVDELMDEFVSSGKSVDDVTAERYAKLMSDIADTAHDLNGLHQ